MEWAAQLPPNSPEDTRVDAHRDSGMREKKKIQKWTQMKADKCLLDSSTNEIIILRAAIR